MSLIKCKECGEKISNSAKICPHCGYKKKKWIGGILLLFALTIIIAYLIPVSDGDQNIANFEQVGYFKKEHSNGSNIRVYSYYVKKFSDNPTTWNEIERFAKNRMHTSGGFTTVFFFNDRKNTPDVTFVAEQFDEKYDKYCIAGYWKFANGVEKFSRYPLK